MNESEIRDFFYKALSTYGLKYGKKELAIEGLRIDIFAIDNLHSPYIIEFKKKKDRHIVGQAAQYLSLVPTYKKEIEEKINFFDIKWENLKVICIATDFFERDIIASEYEPLKGKVYFYKYKIIENSRKQVFSLNIEYFYGKEEIGPLILPDKVINELDIISLSEKLFSITKKEARREYYSLKVLPFLKEICEELKKYKDLNLYPHISYWSDWISIRLGTHPKKSHRASIEVYFNKKSINYGFDLAHSLDEGKFLENYLKGSENINIFIDELLKFSKYSLYIPNTGIDSWISIDSLSKKGLGLLLRSYNPMTYKDCYFRIITGYDISTLSKHEMVNIFDTEYNKFRFIFELLK